MQIISTVVLVLLAPISGVLAMPAVEESTPNIFSSTQEDVQDINKPSIITDKKSNVQRKVYKGASAELDAAVAVAAAIKKGQCSQGSCGQCFSKCY